jgi:hypothetical protein
LESAKANERSGEKSAISRQGRIKEKKEKFGKIENENEKNRKREKERK